MGVLSKLLCSPAARHTSRSVLQQARALLQPSSRAYATGTGDYAVIDHQYDAVVVGAGGVAAVVRVISVKYRNSA